MDNRLGWGIVGIGGIATQEIAPAIAQLPNSVLRHVVSRDQARAAQFAARFGADSATTSYPQLLADPNVDAVYIATPNSLHTEQVLAAARAGKHVLCDKPLATSADEARACVAACAKACVRLGIMFQTRAYGGMDLIRQLVADGEIGPVITAQAEISSGRSLLKGWRTDPAYAGVGSLNNVGVHAIDLLRYLLGSEIVQATAMVSSEPGFTLDTTALALLRFESGALACVNANQSVAAYRPDLVIYGSHGRIVGTNMTRPGLSGVLSVVRGNGDEVQHAVSSAGAFTATVGGFADAVLAGRDPSPSGWDGLASVLVTQALHAASLEGRTIKVGT